MAVGYSRVERYKGRVWLSGVFQLTAEALNGERGGASVADPPGVDFIFETPTAAQLVAALEALVRETTFLIGDLRDEYNV